MDRGILKLVKDEFMREENPDINEEVSSKIERIESLLKYIKDKSKEDLISISSEINLTWNDIDLSENLIKEWYLQENFKEKIKKIKNTLDDIDDCIYRVKGYECVVSKIESIYEILELKQKVRTIRNVVSYIIGVIIMFISVAVVQTLIVLMGWR